MQSTREESKLAVRVAEKVGQTFINSLLVDGTKRAMEIKNLMLPPDAKQLVEINNTIKEIIQKQMTHRTKGAPLPLWCQSMTNGTISGALIVEDQEVKLAANADYISGLLLKSNNQGGDLYVQINSAIRTLCSWVEEAGFFTKSNNTHPCNHFVVWIAEQLISLKSASTNEERLDRLNIIYEVIMWGHNSAKFAKKEMSLVKHLSSIQSCLAKAIQCQMILIEKKSSDDYLKEVSTMTESEIDSIKSAIFSIFLSQSIPTTLINSKVREEKGGLFYKTTFMRETILPVIMKRLRQLEEDPQPDEEGVFFTKDMVKEGDTLIALGTERHYCHFEIKELTQDLKRDSYIFDPKKRELYYIDKQAKKIDITQYFIEIDDLQDIFKYSIQNKDQIVSLQTHVLKHYKDVVVKRKSISDIEFLQRLDQLSVNQKGELIDKKDQNFEALHIQTGFAPDLISIHSNKNSRKKYWKNFVEMLRLIEQMQRINIIYKELQKCTTNLGEINSFVLMLPHIQMAIEIGREIVDKLEMITDEILEVRVRFTAINQFKLKIPHTRGENIHHAADFANETKVSYINDMRERIKKLELKFQKNIKAISSGEKVIKETVNKSYLTILPIYEDMMKLGIVNAKFDTNHMGKAQSMALGIANSFDTLNTKAVEEMKFLSSSVPESPTPSSEKSPQKALSEPSFLEKSKHFYEVISGKKPNQFNEKSISHILNLKNKVSFLDALTESTPSIFTFWRRNLRQSLLAARLAICNEMLENFIKNNCDEKKKAFILNRIELQITSIGYFAAPQFYGELHALRLKMAFIPVIHQPIINVPLKEEKLTKNIETIPVTIPQEIMPIKEAPCEESAAPIVVQTEEAVTEPPVTLSSTSSYQQIMKEIPIDEKPVQVIQITKPEESICTPKKKEVTPTISKKSRWFDKLNEMMDDEPDNEERNWFDPNI